MKELDEVKKEIQPQLRTLEASRKVRYIIYLISFGAYLIPVFIFLFAGQYPEEGEKSYVPLLGMTVAVILGFAIYPILIQVQLNSYQTKFKKLILEQFVKTLYPNLNYNATGNIGIELFKNSKLFRDDFGSVSKGNYFEGTTKTNVKFQFCELKTSGVDGDATNSPALFEGIFFVLDIPEVNFPRLLLVSKFKSYYTHYSSKSSFNASTEKWQNIRTARMNPTLNKLCDVFGVDEEDSYKILNLEFTKALEEFARSWAKSFRISFYEKKIYIALHGGSLFNVDIGAQINGDVLITKMYKELNECIHTINSFSQSVSTFDEASFKRIEKQMDEGEVLDDDLPYKHLIDFDKDR